jgi:hypothetical protein
VIGIVGRLRARGPGALRREVTPHFEACATATCCSSGLFDIFAGRKTGKGRLRHDNPDCIIRAATNTQ